MGNPRTLELELGGWLSKYETDVPTYLQHNYTIENLHFYMVFPWFRNPTFLWGL
jgi:hypothetical protein